jgi:transposase
MRPKAFGHWQTVYGSCRRWRSEGVWVRGMTERRQDKRTRQGRHAESSAGTLDSQRVKAATQGSEVGCDGNKNITGCKRYLLVDTLGLIGAVVVTAANGDDRQGLMILLRGYDVDRVTRLRQTGVDSGYRAEWLRPGVWGLPCPPRALGRWWSIRARGYGRPTLLGGGADAAGLQPTPVEEMGVLSTTRNPLRNRL